ncbi:MAG TPA: glycosyltransferase [Planctomycetota bacterium]|nr:glycosyltransferase [Planctomycetota bacterium]
MRIVMFCHSLRACWNHGNAHFLRGVARALQQLGHDLAIYEPRDAWSLVNQRREPAHAAALARLATVYPTLAARDHVVDELDLDAALDGADAVLVHEWNDPALVARIGAHRRAVGGYALLFHDTHHRAVSAPEEMARYDLSAYDGVLAFGDVVRDLYLARGWTARAWTWHEAADTAVFRPLTAVRDLDLVWIGNWGDDERAAELREFLIAPVAELGLEAVVHGVRYPDDALRDLSLAGIAYRGWIANLDVPAAFARARATVHVPRRPYATALPGIPTIRMFEALACAVPLVSAPWDDREGLFRPGVDYLVARDGAEMKRHLRTLLADRPLAAAIAASGRARVVERHTCAHRARELLAILAGLGVDAAAGATQPTRIGA